MIINNNNDNGSVSREGCGCSCCHDHAGAGRSADAADTIRNFVKTLHYDRATMVKLAWCMGWSGWHYFYFGRVFAGVCHLLLSLIGIIGAASIFFIFLYAPEEHVEFLFTVACLMIIPLPAVHRFPKAAWYTFCWDFSSAVWASTTSTPAEPVPVSPSC